MKKFKISIIAVIALVMGIAGSAFMNQKEVKDTNHPTATAWFKYMGDPGNLAELQDNTMYSYDSGAPCSGQGVICAVKYTGVASSGNHPNAFSDSFKDRISDLFSSINTSDPDISEEN